MPTRKNTTSKNICSKASNLVKSIVNPLQYNKYNKYISNITNTFTLSQQLLLNNILDIKNTNQFTFTFTEITIDDNNTVPPFIDIFRYLITKDEFINKFTESEQENLHKSLALHNSKQLCYNLLDKYNLGKKILDFYYSINHSITSEINIKFPSIKFHNLLINDFTSFKILQDLELKIKKLISFNLEWKGKKINNLVYMFMYNNNYNFEILGNEILKRILFFNIFLNIDTLPNKIIIFLTDKNKEIDENVIAHMHFKTINVNTAVTNGKDIIIYRQQELFKSIFHELIHFHNLDFRHIPPELITYLIKTHNIKTDNKYLLYECVTEALANLLNNLFLSSNIKEFTLNLQNEIIFSTLQVIKILNVCGYKNMDEFSNIDKIDKYSNKINNTDPKKQFKQDSCILSYYILKFYIMMNLDTYFKKCLDSKLKFIQTTDSFNNLMNIFDLARNNLLIKNIINIALGNFSSSKNKSSKNNTNKHHKKQNNNILLDKINKTLRMTCLESNLFNSIL